MFQLPIVVFPEQGPIYTMVDYDLALGYLHSDELAWSYGGMKGRDADWQDKLRPLATADLLRDVATAGFDGLYIDRRGYADRAEALVAEATDVLGTGPMASDNDDLVFFDLRPYARSVEAQLGSSFPDAQAAIIEPPRVRTVDGFYTTEYFPTEQAWSRGTAELRVENDTSSPVRYTVTFQTTAAVPGDWTLHVAGDGVDLDLPLSNVPTPTSFTIEAPPGTSTLHLSSDAPTDQTADPRDLHYLVTNLSSELVP